MPKFISKTELEAQKSDNKSSHYVGEIYPTIFNHGKNYDFKDGMPLETAILWVGAYQLDGNLFPKYKCPKCGKEESLIPYLCGGSVLSGCHTIQFYCTNCHEQFVTNDDIEYFRKIYKYVQANRKKLKPSKEFRDCTSIVTDNTVFI